MNIKLKIATTATVLAAATALAGCASNPCADNVGYRDAQAAPAVKAPEGSTIKPDPAYEIQSGDTTDHSSRCVVRPPQVIDPENPPKNSG